MKLESLVIADQHAAVNTFPGLVHTARHTTKVGNTGSRWPNRKEGAVEGGVGDWGEVVTRWPYRKVRPDHLLSKECLLGRSSTFVGATETHLLVHCRVGRRSSRGRRFSSSSRRNGRRSLLFCFEGVSPSFMTRATGSSGCLGQVEITVSRSTFAAWSPRDAPLENCRASTSIFDSSKLQRANGGCLGAKNR